MVKTCSVLLSSIKSIILFVMYLYERRWWTKVAGGRHRSIIICLALLLALAMFHFVVAIIMFSSERTPEDPYLCTTTGCETIAERLQETLNTSVNPCENFYGFICGDFHESPNMKKDEVENSWSQSADAITFSYKDSKALVKRLRSMVLNIESI